DAPVQAVAAALSIRDLADGADKRLELHIGVETGIAVVEVDPAQSTSATLTGITGPPLRGARALSDAASAGAVRLGATIAELVAPDFELGTDEGSPVPGAIAVSRRARRLRTKPSGQLLGRDDAIAEVIDA